MTNDNDGFAKGLMAGFIAGSVVGAVMALLYAPKSGRELRQNIKDRSTEFLGNADEYLAQARTEASDIINEGKRRSDHVINDARKKAETLMGDAERIISDAREKARNDESKNQPSR